MRTLTVQNQQKNLDGYPTANPSENLNVWQNNTICPENLRIKKISICCFFGTIIVWHLLFFFNGESFQQQPDPVSPFGCMGAHPKGHPACSKVLMADSA